MRYLYLLSFALFLSRSHANAQCASGEVFTVNPAPVGGTYAAGRTVDVCYTVGAFQQTQTNWFHGFVIQLGGGWDVASIAITQMPTAVSANGSWDFYSSVTSSATGQTFGPGVFFNYFTPADNDPGNNYGDNCPGGSGSCTWTLCFSVMVDPNCTGGDLSIAVTATGDGTSGSWSSGSGACDGVLNAVVSNVTCTNPCTYTVSAVPTNPSCVGNDGAVSLDVVGATSALSYSWSNGSTDASLSNIGIGAYAVTVSDAAGCSVYENTTLVASDSAVVNVQMQQPISCANECDGQAVATVVTGTAPFTFVWSSGETDATALALCAGTAYVTLTDANQCTTVGQIDFLNPQPMIVTLNAVAASCPGVADGSINTNIQFGTAPYATAWTPSGFAGTSLSGLPAGTYYVTVTDAYGCSVTAQADVTEPVPMVLDVQAQDVTCVGGSDGSVSVTVSLGAAPYTYTWSNGGYQSTEINLAANTYNLTVTDASGCTATSSAIVNEPLPIQLTLTPSPTTCDIASDGSVVAQAVGGTPAYTFAWSTAETGMAITDLVPGTYSATVVDANGCTATNMVTVIANPLFTVDAGVDTSVIRESSITLNAAVIGGTSSSYAYVWLPEEGLDDATSFSVEASPTETTTYTVWVVDQISGCQNGDEVVVTVLPNAYLFVPNAFSPNGDGLNERFYPITGDGVTVDALRVYNRWGELVYDGIKESGWDGTWNGKVCPMAAYVYVCEYTLEGASKQQVGNVTLMR